MIVALIGVIIGLGIVIGGAAVRSYRSLAYLHLHTHHLWVVVDMQLKRRLELIPSLITLVRPAECVENHVLDHLAELRKTCLNAQGIRPKAAAEREIRGILRNVISAAKTCESLKSSASFSDLHHRYMGVDDELLLAIRHYNAQARYYNKRVHSFPSSWIASLFGFRSRSYFDIHVA